MRIADSLLLSAPAGIFYSVWAAALHRFVGQPNGVPAITALVAIYLLHASIAIWVISDARQKQYSVPYDFASLVFFFGIIFGLLYVFFTRGIRGFVPVLGLIGLTVAGTAAAMCSYLAVWMLRHLI